MGSVDVAEADVPAEEPYSYKKEWKFRKKTRRESTFEKIKDTKSENDEELTEKDEK